MSDPDAVIARLDTVMESQPLQVGVAMGLSLYRECYSRGLLQMRTFSILGTGFLPNDLPAYRGQRFAFAQPALAEWDFEVGKRNA